MARRPGSVPVREQPEFGYPEQDDMNVRRSEYDQSPQLFLGTLFPSKQKDGAFSQKVWYGGRAEGFAIPAGLKVWLVPEDDDSGDRNFVVYIGKERACALQKRVGKKTGNAFWQGVLQSRVEGTFKAVKDEKPAGEFEWFADEGTVILGFKLKEKFDDEGKSIGAYSKGARWALTLEGFAEEAEDDEEENLGGPRSKKASTKKSAPPEEPPDDDCPF